MAEFRNIRSFPDHQISEFGTVRRKSTGRVLKISIGSDGYLQVILRHEGIEKNKRISRLVAETFIGDQPTDDHEVAHGDGNKYNNHISNIRWATRDQNLADKIIHGTDYPDFGCARNHNLAKLKPPFIKEIRTSDKQAKELAEIYGVNVDTIYKVKNFITWKYI